MLLTGLAWSACGDSDSISENECAGGLCSCANTEEMPCCPAGTAGCAKGELQCRLRSECAGGAGGGGGATAECSSAADCPKPGDARCGTATCTSGVCGIKTRPFGKLTSQIQGDCVQIYCDGDGNSVVIEDGSDVYDDGKQCTLDLCKAGLPENTAYEDSTTCPETADGLCYKGRCVPCIDSMPAKSFCTGNNICDGVNCVPQWCEAPEVFCGHTVCSPCGPGWSCASAVDCYYGVCGPGGKCSAPSCSDGLKNGDETGKDCGQATCGLCPDGEGCAKPIDCQSKVCWVGKCQAPACDDGVRNGNETGIDCGGPCGACP